MAKSKYSLSDAQIAKRIKERRGSGSGTDYNPWVRVDEVPSLGRSRQVYSHPANNAVDMVMSSDFLVDSTDKSEPKFALQAKYTDNLGDARTIEKLEIERRYWKQKELPWYLVTEREIDPVAKANIDWLYVTSLPKRQPAHSVLELICSNFLAAIAKQSRAREKF